jgi:hypothetical protein
MHVLAYCDLELYQWFTFKLHVHLFLIWPTTVVTNLITEFRQNADSI